MIIWNNYGAHAQTSCSRALTHMRSSAPSALWGCQTHCRDILAHVWFRSVSEVSWKEPLVSCRQKTLLWTLCYNSVLWKLVPFLLRRSVFSVLESSINYKKKERKEFTSFFLFDSNMLSFVTPPKEQDVNYLESKEPSITENVTISSVSQCSAATLLQFTGMNSAALGAFAVLFFFPVFNTAFTFDSYHLYLRKEKNPVWNSKHAL